MQPRFCGACGASRSPNARFCQQCGQPVRSSSAQPRPKPYRLIIWLSLILIVCFASLRVFGRRSHSVAEQALVPLPIQQNTQPLTNEKISTAPNELTIHVVDVDQGDGIFIQAADGTTAVIDGGYDNGLMLAYLQAQGITRIDLMIASHPHADHIGGLVEVLNTLEVGGVWTSGASHTTLTYEAFLDAIDTHQVPYHEVQTGDQISYGSLSFNVLRSDPNAADLNDTSLVLKLTDGTFSMVFTGDAEASSEKALLTDKSDDLAATVLKVGHHGSYTSSHPDFVRAVHPEVAIYSAGRHNSYGHPHPQTTQTLCSANIKVFGTDQQGTIVVHTDGSQYRIETQLPAHDRCIGR